MYAIPEICPDRDDTSKLHQLGTGIFYLLLYVQQYRYGKQLTDTDGSTLKTDRFLAVFQSYMAENVAVEYLEEPWMVSNHVYRSNLRD